MLAALWEVRCALLLALLVATGAEEAVLANKCCPAGQELNMDGVPECVDDPSSNEPLVQSESVAEVRGRLIGGTKLPLWMNKRTAFYLPEENKHITNLSFKFLQNAPHDAVFRYGYSPCAQEDTQYLHSTQDYRILPNGTMRLNVKKVLSRGSEANEETQIYLPPHKWCSDRYHIGTTLRFMVLACPCEKVLCVPLCCFRTNHLHVKYVTKEVKTDCDVGSSNFVPSIYNDKCLVAGQQFGRGAEQKTHFNFSTDCGYYESFDTTASITSTADGKQCDNTSQSIIYTLLENHSPSCKEGHALVTLNADAAAARSPLRVWLQQNGSAVMENFSGRHFHRGSFCLDRSTMEGQNGSGMMDNAMFCGEVATTTDVSTQDYYYNFLFLAGGAFLLLTVVTHALVPVLRRSDHSKALCCHCVALLVASVTMVSGRVGKRLSPESCMASAFIVQFSFLAAFFWLNVMCFDFAKSFSQMRQNVSRYGRPSYRFILYSLYAWGSAALITGITVAIESLPWETVCHNNPLRPNIGVGSCWFRDKKATFVYYYLPISLVLLTNVVMFGVTVLRIYIVKLGTSILRKKENSTSTKDKKKSDSQMSSVIVRLFLLMGVTWVTEIVSWAVAEENYVFMIMDAINLLRGVAIFAITCCQKRVAQQIAERARAVGSFFGCVEGAAGVLRPSGSSYAAENTSTSAMSLSESVATASTPEAEVVNESGGQ